MTESSLPDLLNDLESSTEVDPTATPAASRRSSSGSGRKRRGKRHSSRRRGPKRNLRNWMIVLGVLVLLVGVAYALLVTAFNGIDRISIEQDPALTRPAKTEVAPGAAAPINFLLLGSDSREPRDVNAAGDQLRGYRTDAILVAQLSPDRENLTIMSIMRDNWVNVQGVGEAKINAAAAFGGIPLTVNTVENFIGARIDHVAMIDFEAFKGLTNSVGGVTVHNSIPYTAQNGGGGFTFAEGEIKLDGDQALSYVRERYAFADGDYQRVRNQQTYLKALISQLLSGDTLTDPKKVTGVFQSIRPYLTVDDSLDFQKAVALGVDSSKLRKDGITMFTSPTLGTGTSADGQSIVLPDWEALEGVRTAFRDGTLNEYVASLG